MGEYPDPVIDSAADSLPAAAIFDAVWTGLIEVLGTATTATLIRRAAKRAAATAPDLPSVVVNRNTVTYEVEIPAIWRRPGDTRARHSLQTLFTELGFLLRELTGLVVIRRLERLAQIREAGFSFDEERHER
jgi:hypothetical protein